jgi:hypothetical protein
MRFRLAVSTLCLASSLAAPALADEPAPVPPRAPAPAATPGEAGAATRTFTLKDGSIFSGELVELVPNDHVTLKLATGEVRRISWSDLAPAKAAESPAPAPPAPPPPPASPPAPEGAVSLTLTSKDARVALYRDTGADWALVCNVPCDTKLDPRARYRIGGRGVTSTDTFHVVPSAPPLALDVKPGSKGAKIAGWITFGVGGATALTGALLLATAPSSYDAPLAFGGRGATETIDPGSTQRNVGIGAMVVGGVAAIVGLALVSQGGTSLEGNTLALQNEARASAPRGAFAWRGNGFVF